MIYDEQLTEEDEAALNEAFNAIASTDMQCGSLSRSHADYKRDSICEGASNNGIYELMKKDNWHDKITEESQT